MSFSALRPRLAPLLLTALLAGCMVGPNYEGPPTVASGAQGGAPFRRIGDLATQPPEVDAGWWRAFNDPSLDRLIEQALANSPSIAIAEARLRQSRATLREQQANLLPSVSANASYLRYRLPPLGLGQGAGGQPSGGQGNGGAANGGSGGTGSSTEGGGGGSTSGGLWSGGFDASWEIDLFGARRRQRDQAQAQAEAAEARVADAQVSLAAEVAQAYIDLRGQQQQMVYAMQSTRFDQQSLALTEQMFARGAASREDVARLRTQLAQTKSQEKPLSAQVEQSLNRIAVLIGREPGFVDADLARVAPVPRVPARVPVDDPAAMLRRRPDIRAAERQIAATTAQVGATTAQMFPTVSLLGFIGLGGPSLGDLSPSDFAAIGTPMLRWNFLDFGRIRAQIRQAEAGRDEALAQYQQTVLQALQDAEDALSTFRGQRSALSERLAADRAATLAAELVRQRYAQGAVSLIDLLDSQRQQNKARQQRAQSEAQVANGYIAIAKSLGLGWRSPRSDTSSSTPTTAK